PVPARRVPRDHPRPAPTPRAPCCGCSGPRGDGTWSRPSRLATRGGRASCSRGWTGCSPRAGWTVATRARSTVTCGPRCRRCPAAPAAWTGPCWTGSRPAAAAWARLGTMSESFDAVDIIRTKRDRGELSPEEIAWVVDAYTREVVADEQMSALAMAILLNGMNRREIGDWTAAMIASGER